MTSLVTLPVKYHGQKTHEKKITQYLEKCVRVEFTDAELEQLCTSLLNLTSLKLARTFACLGCKRFPRNPFFPFFQAESRLASGPSRLRPWEVTPFLEEARRLASDRPQDPRCKALLELIQDRQQMIGAIGSLGNGLFAAMLDSFDDDYDEEDRW
jgi:hypothetical protein